MRCARSRSSALRRDAGGVAAVNRSRSTAAMMAVWNRAQLPIFAAVKGASRFRLDRRQNVALEVGPAFPLQGGVVGGPCATRPARLGTGIPRPPRSVPRLGTHGESRCLPPVARGAGTREHHGPRGDERRNSEHLPAVLMSPMTGGRYVDTKTRSTFRTTPQARRNRRRGEGLVV